MGYWMIGRWVDGLIGPRSVGVLCVCRVAWNTTLEPHTPTITPLPSSPPPPLKNTTPPVNSCARCHSHLCAPVTNTDGPHCPREDARAGKPKTTSCTCLLATICYLRLATYQRTYDLLLTPLHSIRSTPFGHVLPPLGCQALASSRLFSLLTPAQLLALCRRATPAELEPSQPMEAAHRAVLDEMEDEPAQAAQGDSNRDDVTFFHVPIYPPFHLLPIP